jgi:sensor domain DACNV-containing protein
MPENIDRLTASILAKMRTMGPPIPKASILRLLFETAYLATLRTIEGRFVRGSLTFADPKNPELDPPITRRADYPAFTSFGHHLPLTVENVVKLSRAVDRWCGSIAVYGTTRSNAVAWGVLDQLVQHNVRLNREGASGAATPGIITIGMDGVGEISVFRGDLFLGGLREDRLVTRENEVLRSPIVGDRVLPFLVPLAEKIASALGHESSPQLYLRALLSDWASTVARLCIGLRRIGTGGGLLISPSPIKARLDIANPFPYNRLGDSFVLRVLDLAYRRELEKKLHAGGDSISRDLVYLQHLARVDAIDREDELSGAVKLVSSLASVDGLVLLTPLLRVLGFGVKIRSGSRLGPVFYGPTFVSRGTSAREVDLGRFGTRHTSMLRYCRADPNAIGLVVSQDGQVRLMMSNKGSLALWDNVKLMSHQEDFAAYAREELRRREYRRQHRNKTHLGYTPMPKTLRALLR